MTDLCIKTCKSQSKQIAKKKPYPCSIYERNKTTEDMVNLSVQLKRLERGITTFKSTKELK